MPDVGSLEFLKGWGGYTTTATLIVGGLISWWKILPALIEAISNRQSKIEERMGKLLDTATERFEKQLEASDKRHADCMDGQEVLRKRIVALEEEVDLLRRENTGMRTNRLQAGISALRITPDVPISPTIADALEQLDRIPVPSLKERK